MLCGAVIMKTFSFAIAMTVASLVATSAHASEPDAEIGPPKPATTESYGYQPLIGDVVATTLTAAGLVKALSEIGPIDLCGTFSERQDCPHRPSPDHTLSTALLTSGVATYFLASPIIHAAHGHWGKAGLSLGLRAAPIALAAPLLANEDTTGAGALVLLGGIGAAMVIDWTLIANEETKPESSPPARGVSLSPTFDARNGGAGLAAVGTF